MKEGWDYKKLGELALSMADGPFGSNLKKEHYTNRKEVRIIQLSNIGEEGWRDDNIKYTTFEHLETIKRSEVVSGDIVIAKMMPAGRAILCPNKESKYVLSSDAVRVTLKDGLNNRFILFSINSPYFRKQVYENVTGSGRVRTSLTKLRDCKIYLPSLSEQQSIVDYLDSVFAKIDAMKANAEKALNEAKAFFQASLKEMLEPKEGWEEKPLKELGLTQTGTTPSKSDKDNYGDYMEFIRPSEIDCDGNGGIDYNCEMKLSEKGASKGRIFAPNSIFMVCIGATIGKVGFSIKEVSCNQQINVFTPKDDINYKFAYYIMRSPSFQHRVIKEGTSSQATLPIINKGKWEQLSIHFPEINEQEIIASHLDSLSSKVLDLQANFDKISQECDALKQAILRQVFE